MAASTPNQDQCHEVNNKPDIQSKVYVDIGQYQYPWDEHPHDEGSQIRQMSIRYLVHKECIQQCESREEERKEQEPEWNGVHRDRPRVVRLRILGMSWFSVRIKASDASRIYPAVRPAFPGCLVAGHTLRRRQAHAHHHPNSPNARKPQRPAGIYTLRISNTTHAARALRNAGRFSLIPSSMFAIIVRFKPSVRERSQWVGERAIECC
jgi:hypothetical protein